MWHKRNPSQHQPVTTIKNLQLFYSTEQARATWEKNKASDHQALSQKAKPGKTRRSEADKYADTIHWLNWRRLLLTRFIAKYLSKAYRTCLINNKWWSANVNIIKSSPTIFLTFKEAISTYLVYAKPSRHTGRVINMFARQNHLPIPSSIVHLANHTPTKDKHKNFIIKKKISMFFHNPISFRWKKEIDHVNC